MDMSGNAAPSLDGKVQLAHLQRFLTLPRETIPRLTAQEAGRYLRGAAERLGLEYIEIAEVVPTFLLLPPSAASESDRSHGSIVAIHSGKHRGFLPARPVRKGSCDGATNRAAKRENPP